MNEETNKKSRHAESGWWMKLGWQQTVAEVRSSRKEHQIKCIHTLDHKMLKFISREVSTLGNMVSNTSGSGLVHRSTKWNWLITRKRLLFYVVCCWRCPERGLTTHIWVKFRLLSIVPWWRRAPQFSRPQCFSKGGVFKLLELLLARFHVRKLSSEVPHDTSE